MSTTIPHTEIIKTFYDAFTRRDGETMASCYDQNAQFSDPVFPQLQGTQTQDMWRMLTQNGQDLKVRYHIVSAADTKAVVHWEAWYTFSKTQRAVHNKIRAVLTIENGRIIHHHDHFDFWRWSRQALGGAGWILGWSPWLRKKVQKTAMHSLLKFQEAKNSK